MMTASRREGKTVKDGKDVSQAGWDNVRREGHLFSAEKLWTALTRRVLLEKHILDGGMCA